MPRCIGLDIKQGYLLCSEALHFGGRLESVTLSYCPLPEGFHGLDGRGLDTEVFQDLLGGHLGGPLNTDTLCGVLEGPDVVTRATAVPDLTPKEISDHLLTEVYEFKVFEGKEVSLTFHPTGAPPKPSEQGKTVLELAVNEERIAPWQEAISALAPQDAHLESAFLAQLRLYLWTARPGEKNQIVLFVEDDVCHVVNLQGSAVRFLRAFEIGSNALAQAAQERHMAKELTAVEDDFLDETVRTIRYLLSTFPDQAFEQTIHMVARSYVPGQFVEHLQNQLGVPVQFMDPFAVLPVSNLEELQQSGVDMHLFAQSLGASLYGANPDLVPLNVFPKGKFQQRELMRSAVYLLAPVAAAVVLSMLLNVFMQRRTTVAKRQQEALQTELTTLQALSQKKPLLQDTLAYLKVKTAQNQNQSTGNDWPRFIFEMTNIFPRSTWLERLSYDRRQGTVTFEGLTVETSDLFELEENLKESPFLTDVQSGPAASVAPVDQDQTPLNRFKITARLLVREN